MKDEFIPWSKLGQYEKCAILQEIAITYNIKNIWDNRDQLNDIPKEQAIDIVNNLIKCFAIDVQILQQNNAESVQFWKCFQLFNSTSSKERVDPYMYSALNKDIRIKINFEMQTIETYLNYYNQYNFQEVLKRKELDNFQYLVNDEKIQQLSKKLYRLKNQGHKSKITLQDASNVLKVQDFKTLIMAVMIIWHIKVYDKIIDIRNNCIGHTGINRVKDSYNQSKGKQIQVMDNKIILHYLAFITEGSTYRALQDTLECLMLMYWVQACHVSGKQKENDAESLKFFNKSRCIIAQANGLNIEKSLLKDRDINKLHAVIDEFEMTHEIKYKLIIENNTISQGEYICNE